MDNLFKLFYCWQSDTPSSKARYLIREALDHTAQILSNDESVRFRLDVDQDTQGEPGLCDIPSTILRKISQADAFLADMSIVAKTDKGKDCPNPNVLFELGYAFEKIGPERIILVAQENPDEAVQQIFDVRHRRKPISYSFGENDTRATVIQRLAKELAAAIKPIMKLGIRSHSTGDNAVQFGREELELKSLMAVDLIDCDRPVFSILFNPQRHVEKRWLGLTDLETFVRQNVARLSRGDDYPPSQRYTKRFSDGIYNDAYGPCWGMTLSGLFYVFQPIGSHAELALTSRDLLAYGSPRDLRSIDGDEYFVIPVRFREIAMYFQFLRRVANSFHTSEVVSLQFKLEGIQDRWMHNASTRDTHGPCAAKQIVKNVSISAEEFISNTGDILLEILKTVCDVFTLDGREFTIEDLKSFSDLVIK